jgi:hypothetical protein
MDTHCLLKAEEKGNMTRIQKNYLKDHKLYGTITYTTNNESRQMIETFEHLNSKI